MSVYPMSFEQYHYTHKDGSKGYVLTKIINAVGGAIIIRRFGKVGKLNQTQVEKMTSAGAAAKHFDKLVREPERRDYRLDRDPTQVSVGDASALQNYIGRTVYPRIGADNLNHIDPALDTKGVTNPEQTWDFDNNKPVERQAKVNQEALAEAARLREEKRIADEKARLKAEEEARLKETEIARSNPRFGSFA